MAVAIVQALLTLIAMTIVSPLATLASLVSPAILFFSTRYYLHYATPGYRRERMSYAHYVGLAPKRPKARATVDAHTARKRRASRIGGQHS